METKNNIRKDGSEKKAAPVSKQQQHEIDTLHDKDQEYRPGQQEYTHDQERPFQDLSHSRFTRDSEHYGGGGMVNTFEYGEHTGKGPKGWNRSDDRIRDDICEILTQHGEIDASEIEVKVLGGVVTLSGVVESRMVKRLSQDSIERLAGIKEIINDLRIAESQ